MNLSPDRANDRGKEPGNLITHSQIEAVNSFIDSDGILWAVPMNGAPHIMVATPRGMHPDFGNLLRASIMMFKTLAATNVGYDKLIAYAEAVGDDRLVSNILRLQAAVQLTMRCAIDGIENIAKDSEKRD